MVIPAGARHTTLCHRQDAPAASAPRCTRYPLSTQRPSSFTSVWKKIATASSATARQMSALVSMNQLRQPSTPLFGTSELSGSEVTTAWPGPSVAPRSHSTPSVQ